MEFMPSWNPRNIKHFFNALVTVFNFVLNAFDKLMAPFLLWGVVLYFFFQMFDFSIEHLDGAVFRFDNGSSKKVWSAVKDLIIMIVDIENEWRVGFEIINLRNLIIKLKYFVKEWIVIVIDYRCLLYLIYCVPNFDEWVT